MLPFDDNVIKVIAEAYESGFNVPTKFFLHEKDKINEDMEVYFNSPLFIVKPKGIEFTYILYWTGKRMKGGFISINNNYSGVQRGEWSRNGETLFAGHVHELKRCYKKLVNRDEPQWLAISFVMDETGKIFFWGYDTVEYYKDQLERLTGHDIIALTELYDSDEKIKKPEGFISSLLICQESKPAFVYTDEPYESISKAWKELYTSLISIKKCYTYCHGIEPYMRASFAKLNIHRKLDKIRTA